MSPATAAAWWRHAWPKGPWHLPTPGQERGMWQVRHGQIQTRRLPQTFCCQLCLPKTPSETAIKLLHNTDSLCINVFAIILQREGLPCPPERHTIRQSKRVVNKPLIVQWDVANGKANVHCQNPWRDSDNIQVMLDVSVMKLFSVALNLLQKS